MRSSTMHSYLVIHKNLRTQVFFKLLHINLQTNFWNWNSCSVCLPRPPLFQTSSSIQDFFIIDLFLWASKIWLQSWRFMINLVINMEEHKYLPFIFTHFLECHISPVEKHSHRTRQKVTLPSTTSVAAFCSAMDHCAGLKITYYNNVIKITKDHLNFSVFCSENIQ